MRETWRRFFGEHSGGWSFGHGDQLFSVLRDLLVVMGVLTLCFVLVMSVTGWYSSPSAMYSLLFALGFWPFFLGLLKRRIIRPVALSLIVLCSAIAVGVTFQLGSIRVLQMSGVFIAIVIGTLVLGRRAGAVALGVVLSLLWSIALWQLYRGSASDPAPMVFNQAATFSFFALMIYAILVIVRQHYIEALAAQDASAAEHRRASLALAESEARFATFFRDGPLASIIVDPVTGAVRDANDEWLLLTGRDAQHVLGENLDMLGLFDVAEPLVPAFTALAKGGVPIAGMPLAVRAADERWVRCELSARAVQANGRTLVIAQFVDVTARQLAEQRLRENEARLETMFELSPDAWTLHEFVTGKYIAVNRSWESWSGYRREEAIGRTALELKLVSSEEEMQRMVQAMREGGGFVERLDTYFVRRNGETRRCEMSGRIFTISGVRYLITSSRDTTEDWATRAAIDELNTRLEAKVEERTAELAEVNRALTRTVKDLSSAQGELVRQEKLASLGAMVAGIAHELNTPIGNSVTLASTLSHEAGRTRKAVEGAALRRSQLLEFLQTCDEAARLLNRNLAAAHELISSFKQVAVDQTSENRRSFDFAHTLEEIVATLRPSLRTTQISLELAIAGDARIDAYPGALARVLTNLVENARVHGFANGSPGTIRVSAAVRDDDWVTLDVTDSGCGIPPENHTKVFDPFFTTRLGRGGSGLGLHIVFTLVTRVLGGRIALESPPDGGTRFHIELPRIAPKGAEAEDRPLHEVSNTGAAA
ncbi:PAS domain S-box protein [Niveibacterium sp. 24ML]|uniref:PAS domain S-box protein n=1 Tax=Niveibacterium sp. 24ML TaxID=2985512 RepID=UPI0022706A0A|nr:PAS domain S-box protein [Niveibacterium sp. 24ML]MCX9158223.1 PAS domain S-box protein [Niveibacterium sp. 24ML]